MKIIESTGTKIIAVERPFSGEVLFKLDIPDMQEIVLNLIEAGFSKIKGINTGPL